MEKEIEKTYDEEIVYYLTLTSPEHAGSSGLASGIWIIKKDQESHQAIN